MADLAKTQKMLESITVSDIEIARAAKKKPIFEIGESLNIPAADLVPMGSQILHFLILLIILVNLQLKLKIFNMTIS